MSAGRPAGLRSPSTWSSKRRRRSVLHAPASPCSPSTQHTQFSGAQHLSRVQAEQERRGAATSFAHGTHVREGLVTSAGAHCRCHSYSPARSRRYQGESHSVPCFAHALCVSVSFAGMRWSAVGWPAATQMRCAGLRLPPPLVCTDPFCGLQVWQRLLLVAYQAVDRC